MAYNNKLTYSENKQNWRIEHWLAQHGVKAADFDCHPEIDSVVQLINIRDYLWERMNISERATWGAYWGYVYTQKKPLKKKFWARMESIVKTIDAREQQRTHAKIKLKQSRLKQNPQNKDHNNVAKGSDLSKVIGIEMEQQGCRQVLDIPPWE